MKLLYVDTASALETLCDSLRDSDTLAVDTEFLREKTYYAELCLIQVATADVVACIDPLALDDTSRFFELLYDPAKVKVLHAARQDLELFFHAPGGIPQPVFDTQVAAGLLGHPPQVGYGPLVETLLGITLAKAHTRTNWKRRPLSDEQIEYAADDVRHLLPIYEELRSQLEESGRAQWAKEDCELLTEPSLYVTNPADSWRRVKRAGRLMPEALRRLQALAAWREREAMRRNLPRRWVVGDDVLLLLAESRARSHGDMQEIQGVPAKLVDRFGDALLAEMNDVAPTLPMPSGRGPAPGPEERTEARRLAQIARSVAGDLNIDSAVLATQRDLQAIVAGRRDLPVLKGWRREQVGNHLLAEHEAAGGSAES